MKQLPSDFVQQMERILGEEQFKDFQDAITDSERITSIRLNPRKKGTKSLSNARPVEWCSNGYYLAQRPLFTLDPLFHAGVYYAQEASSMFLEHLVKRFIHDDSLVLDLCASPGGKSTLLASLLNGNGWLVSNEVMKSRVGILNENLTKWGLPNVTVTQNDPKDFSKLRELFDIMVIDAPCSGEGMFRKDDKAIDDWSLDNVQLCSERQRRIVSDAFPSLKEGGILIYSTCTYNEEENEENIKWMVEKIDAKVLCPQFIEEDISGFNLKESGIVANPWGFHFYPHKTEGEGFFISILQKKETEGNVGGKNKMMKVRKEKNSNKSSIPQPIKEKISNWLSADDYSFMTYNDTISAVRKTWADTTQLLCQNLHIVRNGVTIGEIKGKDIIPDESLALSWCLNTKAFPIVSCDRYTAIKYLRKENLYFENEPTGFILLSYKDTILGFCKNIGTRCNNLYPNEWRIRMEMDEDRLFSLFD